MGASPLEDARFGAASLRKLPKARAEFGREVCVAEPEVGEAFPLLLEPGTFSSCCEYHGGYPFEDVDDEKD